MRDYTRKAKRVDNGEWVEGYLFFIADTPYIICDGEEICMDGENADLYATEWYAIDENTICEPTGLTDKNGNKIWENDILCTNNKEKYIVKYRFGGFEMHHRAVATPIYAYAGTDLYINENTLNLQVIGNIFDHPDLLKGE